LTKHITSMASQQHCLHSRDCQ